MHRPRLGEVERLALRDALHHVHQDHIAQLALHRVLGHGGADIAGADDRELGTRRHQSVSMFLTMAVPNSEHFTSFAPSIRRAKS